MLWKLLILARSAMFGFCHLHVTSYMLPCPLCGLTKLLVYIYKLMYMQLLVVFFVDYEVLRVLHFDSVGSAVC